MKLINRLLENTFFLKLILTYSLIIILGIIFTAYLVTKGMMDELIEAQSNYEKEILTKVRKYTDEKLKTVDTIFTQFYLLNYYSSYTISDLLSPYKNINMGDDEKQQRVFSFIMDVCRTNTFITDMMIIDYGKEDTFFYSNEFGRDISLNQDIFKSDFFKMIKKSGNSRFILSNNIPSYIVDKNIHPVRVITIYVNLYDTSYFKVGNEIGAVVVNINPQIISEVFEDIEDSILGNVLVIDDAGTELFNLKNQSEYKNINLKDFHNNEELIINKLTSDVYNLTFINVVEKEKLNELINPVKNEVIKIIVLCLVVLVFISIFAARILVKRIKRLVKSIKIYEKDGYKTKISVGTDDELGYLEKSFNQLCKKMENYITKVYLSEIKVKTAQLKVLQAQINPHFMFNTLEAIRVTALINKDKQTAKMVHILGNMFRWNINMKDMIIEFSDEIEYINSYIELQKIRYSYSFDVNINISEDILRMGIPKFILQPIVENAIYHGLSGNVKDKQITINGKTSRQTTVIEVIDNGEGIDTERLGQVSENISSIQKDDDLYNIGLRNVHQRIIMLFGDSYGLAISSEVNKGTKTTIEIPALSKKEMDGYVQSNYC